MSRANVVEPWERQPGESQKAYEAFCVYRDMGPGERSIRKVARKLNKSATLIARWSTAWNWVERVMAWDDEMDRQARLAQLKEIKEMNKRHIEMARAMQAKALKRLKDMLPEEMTPEQVRQYLLAAAKLERLAMGEPEEVVEERRRTEEYERSAADTLITDARFLEAIQRALAEAEEKGDIRGGSGQMGRGQDRKPVLEETD